MLRNTFLIALAIAILALVPLSPSNTSGAAPGQSAEFDQAVASFKSKHYAQALGQFQALTDRRTDPTTHYYMGLCYHYLNQIGRAQKEYEWVAAAAPDPALRQRAQTALSSLGKYQSNRTYQGHGGTSSGQGGGGAKPQVIDFYTTWCGPCKRLAPILAEVESSFRGQVTFQRLDCEAPENEQTVQKFNIDAYPTVVFIDGSGREVNRLVGLYSKGDYVSQVGKLAGR